MLPADGGRWFGTEADDAGQVDGAAHPNEHFAAAHDRGARLCLFKFQKITFPHFSLTRQTLEMRLLIENIIKPILSSKVNYISKSSIDRLFGVWLLC